MSLFETPVLVCFLLVIWWIDEAMHNHLCKLEQEAFCFNVAEGDKQVLEEYFNDFNPLPLSFSFHGCLENETETKVVDDEREEDEDVENLLGLSEECSDMEEAEEKEEKEEKEEMGEMGEIGYQPHSQDPSRQFKSDTVSLVYLWCLNLFSD